MKKLSLFALSCLLLAASCKKPNETAKPNSFGLLNGTMPILFMPYVEDGMLVFKDIDAYDRYIQYFDTVRINLTDEQKNYYISNEEDPREDMFNSVETSLGFSSLRKLNYENFTQLNQVGWDKPEDIPTFYKSSKSAEQSTLNQYGEVKIGDKIRKVLSKDYELYIDTKVAAVAKHILEGARSLGTNYPNGSIPLEELRTLDYSMRYLNIIDLGTGERIFAPSDETPLSEKEISGIIQNGDKCVGQFNQVTLKSFTLIENVTSWYQGNPGGTPSVAYFDITFGDGQYVNNIHGNGGPFNISFDRLHIYNASGSYTITVKAKMSPTGGYVAQRSFNVSVNNSGACSRDKKDKTYFWNVTSDQKLRCELEFWRSWHFPSGNWPRNARASSENLKKEGNKWKVRKAEALDMMFTSKAYKENCVPHDLAAFVANGGYWVQSAGYEPNSSSMFRGSGKMHNYDLYYNTLECNFSVKINGTPHFKTFIMSACN